MASPSTISKRDPRTLPELVQSLPQELFDRIYEETLDWELGFQYVDTGNGRTILVPPDSPDGSLNIMVNSQFQFSHPPTSLLRVDRATRYRLLRKFYSHTNFTIFGTKGEIKAFVSVKARKSTEVPLLFGLQRHAMSTSYTSPDVHAFARVLWGKGLSHGLKWRMQVYRPGDVFRYDWSWDMERPCA